MELLSTIFWWAVRIFGIWFVFAIIVNILLLWSQEHKNGKVAKSLYKTLDKVQAIAEAPGKLEEKLNQWEQKTMAQGGNLESIYKFYEFQNNDVKSKEYIEILHALDKAQLKNPYDKIGVKNLRDIVLNKILYDENAEQYLSAVTSKEADFIRNHRLFQRCLNEGNIQGAQNVLSELQKNNCLKIEPRLLSVFYYRFGLLYEKGENGNKKDIKKACELYKKSVLEYDCSDCMDVLVNLGLLLLSGEIDGVIINREYFFAIHGIDLANQAGNMNAKKLAETYGVDGVIVKSIRAKAVTYHFPYGYQLVAPEETIKYLHLMAGLRYRASTYSVSFENEYTRRFSTMDQLMNGIQGTYKATIAKMLEFGVQVLQFYGIDQYDVVALADATQDLSLWSRVPKFKDKLDRLNAKAKKNMRKLNSEIKEMKESRPRWTGGAIGTTIGGTIKAAVKSSIAAAAMNTGTDVLYNVAGGITKGMYKVAEDLDKAELFKKDSTKSEFCTAVRVACIDISETVCKILKESMIVSFPGLEGEIIYQGEIFSMMDNETLSNRIDNTSESEEPELLQALLLEKLRRNPFSNNTFLLLSQLVASDTAVSDTLKQYFGDFGLEWSKSERGNL